VSDAGTPGIADPGAQLAAAAIAAGVPVFPVPGANAALSGLIASGLPAESFTFHGFLPSKQGQRRSVLEALPRGAADACVLRDAAPDSGGAGGCGGGVWRAAQHVVVARELTKLHEEFLRGPCGEVLATLADGLRFAARWC
jgi:16S rRNA (cytidine1402-2'-O)-methyltransferase